MKIGMIFSRNSNSKRRQASVLTHEQRQMYAAEKLENFRWISKLVATYSSHTLSDADLVSEEIYREVAELGQFAEIAYSAIPVQFLLDHLEALSKPRFPLENYNGLEGAILVDSYRGTFAELPGYVAFRPTSKQLIVAISGTSSCKHALQDLRAIRTRHPSGQGSVHTGFWDLYQGIKEPTIKAIRKGLLDHSVDELVLTGHSMGGSIAYLLCMDILAADLLPKEGFPKLKIAVFGTPRAGDAGLVRNFGQLIASCQEQGHLSFTEFSVKGYNDGVPALPPVSLGYRHFANRPLYTQGGKLYRTPASESEHALFRISEGNSSENVVPVFPRGGHNYYNGRDLEQFLRRITWLDRASPLEQGWEERYIELVNAQQ